MKIPKSVKPQAHAAPKRKSSSGRSHSVVTGLAGMGKPSVKKSIKSRLLD